MAITVLIGTSVSASPHLQLAPDGAWRHTITSGQVFGVTFDALTRPVGTIRPNGFYVVAFKPVSQSWTASGPMHPNGYQANVTYPAGSACNPNEFVICIWGAAFGFDDRGQILSRDGGGRIGQMRRLTVRDRVAAGQPFSVSLDALSTNIGTIKPGGQYTVTFLPVERAWTAAGPVHPSGFQTHTDAATTAQCDPAEYTLCIWGAPFRFDEQGQVRSDAHGVVGRLNIDR